MTKVLVTKDKLDTLAEIVGGKSNTNVPLTVDEMITAADSITGGGITPTGNIDITSAGVTDVTNYATATVPQGEMYATVNSEFYTENGQKKWRYRGTALIDGNDGYGAEGYIADTTVENGNWETRNAIASGTTITPSTSSQTIGGANYMMEGAVTVSAMPSGTAGTPTASKGAVNNHSISVTPSVTNTTGYITGGTKTGTAVSVSASELVSGTLSVTQNGTADVTNYASIDVSVSGGGVSTDTKTVTASNYPVSLQFTSMKGEPKMFTVRLNAQVSSSGSTTYYYIVDITSHGTTTHGNCFRIGNTRRVDNITSGYSWSYSGTTLTITSSASSRSASPGAFYSGSYELMYVY